MSSARAAERWDLSFTHDLVLLSSGKPSWMDAVEKANAERQKKWYEARVFITIYPVEVLATG